MPSGIRVITENIAHARSVALGYWVGVGRRDEPAFAAGSSHFLEHLLFKGSEKRGASAIARATDALGGEMNAFTTQEHTAYYMRLPAQSMNFGLDLLAEVIWEPVFRPHEVDAERQVILEEILVEFDSPDDLVMSVLAETLFPDHPLGQEVLGTPETITALSPADIKAFHDKWYKPVNIVVAVAGALEHEEVVEAVERGLASAGGPSGGVVPVRESPMVGSKRLGVIKRKTEQAHLAIALPGFAHDDDDRFAMAVLNQALGGGMSSRLFQIIREERGLAYSVYSSTASYEDCGALVIYAGTSPNRAPEVYDLIQGELERCKDDGIDDEELTIAKGYLQGATLLGLEEAGNCMARLGQTCLEGDEVPGVDELVAHFGEVTADDVNRVIERVLGPAQQSLAVVSPLARSEVEGWRTN
ncbi:MAG: M16 family metallopeptidase [Acidimicrobiales bacterium]